MRLHSDTITTADIVSALAECKRDGTVHPDVQIDVNEVKGSRKRKGAIEIRFGAPSGTPTFWAQRTVDYLAYVLGEATEDILKIAKRSGRRFARNGHAGSYMSGNTLRMAATWHETGYILEKLFEEDPNAIIGNYDGVYDYQNQTGFDNISWLVWNDTEWAIKSWNGRVMEWN